MVEVICDTNFLIHLATRRIKNIDNLDVEIGQITFVVPQVVKNELSKLAKNPEKNQDVQSTINYIKNLKTIPILGTFADKELLECLGFFLDFLLIQITRFLQLGVQQK